MPATAPAQDAPSGRQAETYVASLRLAGDHNGALFDYATTYVDRLLTSRAEYAATEGDNTHRLRREGS